MKKTESGGCKILSKMNDYALGLISRGLVQLFERDISLQHCMNSIKAKTIARCECETMKDLLAEYWVHACHDRTFVSPLLNSKERDHALKKIRDDAQRIGVGSNCIEPLCESIDIGTFFEYSTKGL